MIARARVVRVALLVSFLAGSGCGNSTSASMSPIAPSSVGGGGATIMGSVGGSSAVSSGVVRKESASFTVTITGTGISATVSPGGSFTLNGVPTGNVELRMTGPALDARMTITAVSIG